MVKDNIPKTSNKFTKLNLDWEYITIHNTGNPKSTARNERNYLTNPSNTSTTGFHIVIDAKEAIECIPLNIVAWHAGDGYNGPGNRKSIGIEFCESGDFEKTFRDGAKLVAELLMSKGYGTDRIKKHKDWSGKICPRLIIPRWEEFIALVQSSKADTTNSPVAGSVVEVGAKGLEYKPLPKCYVIFRPYAGWEGEYGFDWVRFQDENIKTKDNGTKGNDLDTKVILGKYLSKGCDKSDIFNRPKKCPKKDDCPPFFGIFNKYCIDINGWSKNFTKDSDTEYKKYESANLKGSYSKNGGDSHSETSENIPVLTIVKGKTITLKLRVFRTEIVCRAVKSPAMLKWVYNTKVFSIVDPQIDVSAISEGKSQNFDIKLTCNAEFSTDEYIEVVLENESNISCVIPTLCGKLRVLPNDANHWEEKKIVFIKVRIDIGNTKRTASIKSNEQGKINQYLSQAYVKVKDKLSYVTLEIDPFDSSYVDTVNKYLKRDADPNNLLRYLKQMLSRPSSAKLLGESGFDKKYDDYFKVFLINETCNGLGGFSSPEEKACVIFDTASANDLSSTITHELMHSLGLAHTFTAKKATNLAADFTYTAKVSDNIMDYSHLNNTPIKMMSTFYWQWKRINSKL